MTNKRFFLLRTYYGLTQQQVADAIGCTKQAVSLFERGDSKSSFIEEFYNHKFMRNLRTKLISECMPMVSYQDFVLGSYIEED